MKNSFWPIFVAISMFLVKIENADCRTQTGICSYYTGGGTTASGEPYNENGMTGAHKELPFNTKVRVQYNGKSVTIRINDRGPFVTGRILDLSRGAAAHLGILQKGLINPCTIEILDGSSNRPGNNQGKNHGKVGGCKALWDNTCVKNPDCCSGKCDRKAHWKTGVCKN
ncbi:endolytic peptidoglycan transglycosylase RlpA-like [Aphidius gifuensis]|uniref:endolytic peptidoglycan transglycosylase RlpA-like n=1 Tax=Aphidius gifuensis TaxID=684658 RepID=UPI001CDCE00D|nr:endolytic peptidoglycan transglycosylase RlpA-like [Aphidius gifuensis]